MLVAVRVPVGFPHPHHEAARNKRAVGFDEGCQPRAQVVRNVHEPLLRGLAGVRIDEDDALVEPDVSPIQSRDFRWAQSCK